MASFNNEKYIAEQIESIIQQTNENWRLIIQDDHSTDSTYSIIEKFQDQHKDKISIKQNAHNSGSAKSNFLSMLPFATSQYVMLSDGDDYWLPQKIQKTYEKMIESETLHGTSTPILVHTDLGIVDQDLKTIADSMFATQMLNPDRAGLNQLLVQNMATGCTFMMNQKLMEILKTGLEDKDEVEKPKIVMHDWWIALSAAAFGRIECLKEPTILYRQHGNNTVGAKNVKSIKYIVGRAGKKSEIQSGLLETYEQAATFSRAYANILPEATKEILTGYQKLMVCGKIKKMALVIKYGFLKYGFLRVIGQLFYI